MAREITKLSPEQLRFSCDELCFQCETTADLPELEHIIGQERAVEAIEFGMDIIGDGYNICALGPMGAGRTTTIQRFVKARSKERPVPDDWCYVHNFKKPHRPIYLRLPPGKGNALRNDLKKIIDDLKTNIRQAFEREDFHQAHGDIMQQLEGEKSVLFSTLDQKAKSIDFSVQRGPTGVVFLPVIDDKPLTAEQFELLPDEKKKHIEDQGLILRQELQKILRSIREIEGVAKEKIQDLERKTVLFAVGDLIDAVKEKYKTYERVEAYLDAVKEDIVSNARNIVKQDSEGDQAQNPFGMAFPQLDTTLDKYKVNVIVDNANTRGAPVVLVGDPTFQNLIGRVERIAFMGMLMTNFSMIKPGAFHQANGGYLIVEAEQLLSHPYAYNAMINAIKNREIKITDISEMMGAISTEVVEPEPIPLDVKVIIIGNPAIYYALYEHHEDFSRLFKVKADFNVFMERTPEHIQMYARFLSARCNEDGLCHFTKGGIARVVEYGAELVGDQSKLSTRFSDIHDLARESHYWAQKANSPQIEREHVQKAIDAKTRRFNKMEERLQEMIERGDIFIDTQGETVGQVNGLSVMSLGDYTFGKPSRITARAYAGRGGVVNIEREVRMSGPIHNKGVMTLSGYLNGKYGQEKPLSLSASIAFEQLYEGVEGDSASSTELYSLLSSLSGFPIKQGLAVTGSINQHGEIQPIGGVNEKIQGYFDVCKAKGLNGEQGVLIPKTNVPNLMLREEIIQAVRDGQFHIYSVGAIDEGIEILTGKPFGELTSDGEYPEGTVNHAVILKLGEYAKGLEPPEEEDGGGEEGDDEEDGGGEEE